MWFSDVLERTEKKFVKKNRESKLSLWVSKKHWKNVHVLKKLFAFCGRSTWSCGYFWQRGEELNDAKMPGCLRWGIPRWDKARADRLRIWFTRSRPSECPNENAPASRKDAPRQERNRRRRDPIRDETKTLRTVTPGEKVRKVLFKELPLFRTALIPAYPGYRLETSRDSSSGNPRG